MIPYSGGTSLESTLAAIHGEVCIDFQKMKKVININEQDIDVVVQPGISYDELNDILAEKGLFFPPDPGPGAEIGGMIAQGCSGTNAYFVCVPCRYPLPHILPEPIAILD